MFLKPHVTKQLSARRTAQWLQEGLTSRAAVNVLRCVLVSAGLLLLSKSRSSDLEFGRSVNVPSFPLSGHTFFPSLNYLYSFLINTSLSFFCPYLTKTDSEGSLMCSSDLRRKHLFLPSDDLLFSCCPLTCFFMCLRKWYDVCSCAVCMRVYTRWPYFSLDEWDFSHQSAWMFDLSGFKKLCISVREHVYISQWTCAWNGGSEMMKKENDRKTDVCRERWKQRGKKVKLQQLEGTEA